MSSSRILSSRPSASCIMAKPIARTIRGRGRNASPFFAAQKLGKRGVPSEPAGGTMLHVSPSRKPHSPLLGAVGHWRFPLPSRKQESRGGFSVSVCRGHCFMALRPGTRTTHRWGTGRFRTVPPEVGKPSGLFPRARRGHCFMARCPGTLTVHRRCCGAMDAFAPSRREWNPCHKRKKRRKFPPLF